MGYSPRFATLLSIFCGQILCGQFIFSLFLNININFNLFLFWFPIILIDFIIFYQTWIAIYQKCYQKCHRNIQNETNMVNVIEVQISVPTMSNSLKNIQFP